MINFGNKKTTHNYALLTFNVEWRITNELISVLVKYFKQKDITLDNYFFDNHRYKSFSGKLDKLTINNEDRIILMSLFNGKQAGESQVRVDLSTTSNESKTFGYIFIEIVDSIEFDFDQFLNILISTEFKIDYGFTFKGILNKYSIGYILGMKQKIGLWGTTTEIVDLKWRQQNSKILEGFIKGIYLVNILNQNQTKFPLSNDMTLIDLIDTDDKFGTLYELNNLLIWKIKEENIEWVRKKISTEKIIL